MIRNITNGDKYHKKYQYSKNVFLLIAVTSYTLFSFECKYCFIT